MGLLTNSENIRKGLETKNYFKPETPYDLNSDIVTKTLNTLQASGFDPRNNSILSTIERLVDNTALVQVANQRLLIEMGRRVASNLVKDNLPIVNPRALFDKNPDTKFLTKRINYNITDENQEKTTLGKLLSKVKGAAGIEIRNSILDNKDIKVGSKELYKYLGSGQKQQLNTLIGFNNYGFWALPNTTPSTISIFNFLDGRTTQFNTYTYSNVDKTLNQDYFLENKYTNDQQGTSPANFVNTLNSGDASRKALDEYGFGRTSIEKDSTATQEEYRGTSGDIIWGDDNTIPSNINRGLLYYTKNISKTTTLSGQLINQKNKQYKSTIGGKDIIINKGSSTRSWTVDEKYDKFTSLLKYNGNSVNNSVLKDSVIPKIYPKTLSKEDNKRFMFSIENLAWSKEDFLLFNLPDSEQGYYGGRLMWFPFYGVQIDESSSAEYDETKFLGRIEPVYSYAGGRRSATLKFMLIMDYPPDFKGTQNATLVPVKKPLDEITPITPTNNNLTELDPVTIYFDNNIDIIDTTYELTGEAGGIVDSMVIPDRRNLYSLNKEFNVLSSEQSKIIGSDDGQYYSFIITGYASKLATNDYNVGLGFRRAYNLMNYLINNSGKSLQLINPDNFDGPDFKTKLVNGVSTKITIDDFGSTSFKFKAIVPNGGEIKFTIFSEGEEGGCSPGESKNNIDLECAKRDRRAVSFGNITGLKIAQTTVEDKLTSNEIDNLNSLNNVNDTTDTKNNNISPFKKEFSISTPIHPLDDNKQDYFRPAYHSQTPEDFHKRLTFLQQLTRPGKTIESNTNNQGSNSIFGKQPVCILSLGDFFNTKIIVKNIDFSYKDVWDLNPEGMGVQPMIAEITMGIEVLGGQSLATPIDRLQRAVDFNFYGNSTYYGNNYYSKGESITNPDTGEVTFKGVGPFYQESEQIEVNKKLFT
jgi:hypothetical protein